MIPDGETAAPTVSLFFLDLETTAGAATTSALELAAFALDIRFLVLAGPHAVNGNVMKV